MRKYKYVFARLDKEVDHHGRRIAIDSKGNFYLDVSLRKYEWCCTTEEGEPLYRVPLIIVG